MQQNTRPSQITRRQEIDVLIDSCFDYLSAEDVQKFRKKFRVQPPDSDEEKHTIGELILGAYLSSNGKKISYERKINAQKPDWSIQDELSAVRGIVELVNLHIDKATDIEIERQRQIKNVVAYRRDGNKNNLNRLYEHIEEKAQIYQALVNILEIPYIIAICSDSRAIIELDEIHRCLFDPENGLFRKYPEVSGVVHFERSYVSCLFHYVSNPNTTREMVLPANCIFPLKPA